VISAISINLKNIDIILRVVSYGAISIISFLVFISGLFIQNLAVNGSISDIEKKHNIKINLIDGNILLAVGFFALSFMIQPVILPIYRKNANQ